MRQPLEGRHAARKADIEPGNQTEGAIGRNWAKMELEMSRINESRGFGWNEWNRDSAKREENNIWTRPT